jgi:hypothetical protein
MKHFFSSIIVLLLAINISHASVRSASFTDSITSLRATVQSAFTTYGINKGIQHIKNHPVIALLVISLTTYGLYTIIRSGKTEHADDNNNGLRSVAFKAPQYDIQSRLYKALLAMHFEENNQDTLGSYFDNLQQFKIELGLERFGTNIVLQEVEKKLTELIGSMNDCLSLADHKDSKTYYEEVLVKYTILVSFLCESNKSLIKVVQG